METLRLSQRSDLTGIKRHTLNARLVSFFEKQYETNEQLQHENVKQYIKNEQT